MINKRSLAPARPWADDPWADQPWADQPWADQPWADQPWASQAALRRARRNWAPSTKQNGLQVGIGPGRLGHRGTVGRSRRFCPHSGPGR